MTQHIAMEVLFWSDVDLNDGSSWQGVRVSHQDQSFLKHPLCGPTGCDGDSVAPWIVECCVQVNLE